jgi:hypothetical protein
MDLGQLFFKGVFGHAGGKQAFSGSTFRIPFQLKEVDTFDNFVR